MWCQVRSGLLAAFGGLLVGKGVYTHQLITVVFGALIVVYALYRLKVASCALRIVQARMLPGLGIICISISQIGGDVM
jgi:hypothetical protein